MKIAENIRALRREKGLTQEQLAGVLGVTTGAVYKWEAGLSQPELGMLAGIADFFDTSVDVIIGYEVRNNRPETIAERLSAYRNKKDRAGLAGADMALKKYPNNFSVVYGSASLYLVFGMETGEAPLLRRAIELLESARLLLAQNTDPRISESTLCGEMAEAWLGLGNNERAVELMKKHNVGGMYNDEIGLTLAAYSDKPEEAVPYLSEAILKGIVRLIQTVFGYVNVYFTRKDYTSVLAVIEWGRSSLDGLRNGDAVSFIDKVDATLFACSAAAHLGMKDTGAARMSLCRALELSARFDAAPSYDVASLRFVTHTRQFGVYDDLGTTALESVEKAIGGFDDPALVAMWGEVKENEGKNI